MKTALINEITTILKEFPKYWNNEVLERTKVINDLENNDPSLLKALFKNKTIKERYTETIDEITIFNKNELISLLSYKGYWQDSYTKYSNKIGLTSEGKYLEYNSDVILDFPFKDCVLEGGMSNEEKGKNEVFFNEVIAKDEIDTLLAPKVLHGAKRYSQAGIEENITEFKDSDNLIIKGNNLIALHSLKERYAGKVKLIYIDPPYNTGSDSFMYNDKFNRSTWLTFMKNRIEAAYNLLAHNGIIAIQCSFHHFAYLKVLLDSILGEDKHILTFNVLVRHPERNLTSDKDFNDVIEYTLIYSKDATYKLPKIEKNKTQDDYTLDINLTSKEPDDIITMGGKKVKIFLPNSYTINKIPPSETALKSISIRGSIREKNSSGRFYVKYLEPLRDQYPENTLFLVPNMGDDFLGERFFQLPEKRLKNGIYFQGMPLSSNVTMLPYPNFIDFHKDYNLVNNEGVYSFRNGKKPENLISFYIQVFSSPSDIVLDFFMGSGTTQAVAHKMNRQYIGIEQMDYINEISVPRLQKVIEGEQGGISKEVEWQGGGSFVYTELKALNNLYIEMIQSATDTEQLLSIFKEMMSKDKLGYSNAYLDFRIDLEKLAKDLYEVDGLPRKQAFQELELHQQKELLIGVLDKNQLYVNYSEIDDESLQISENEKSFNRSFYQDSEE